ncbi:MAG: glutathione S-transferase family protein [Alphaproteobacteria bacterium]|jgi:glutathione S-transferase|nr:glutathione S-transferase family protein [Alphaproteobacteria bacterium]
MKFYDLAGSPNTRRVRIFLAEKGLDIPTVMVDMMKGENRTPEFLETKNSLGLLPVLELDDGSCITESVAICRYLDTLHPEPPMFGRDAREQASVEMWNRRMELEILYPAMQTFVHSHKMWAGRMTQILDWADACREKIRERYDWLDKELAGREFIATDDYTVADITAQCAVLIAKGVCDVRIADDQANLAAWWERVTARPTARA